MASEISCLFLFGLLTLIHGKPINNEEYTNDIQRLLEELSDKQGKYDIALSHHEDGPKSHHEDTARFTEKRAPRGLLRDVLFNPILNPNLNRNKPSGVPRSDSDNFILQQLLTLQDDRCDKAKCKTYKWRSESQSNKEYNTVDEVLEYLSDLDKKFEDDNYDNRNRCAGNRCGRERNDREENQNRVDNYVRNQDRFNLRCKGACNRIRHDNDDDDNIYRDNLRCAGDRCGRNRDNDDRDDRNRDDARDDRNRDDARDDRNRDDVRDVRNRDDARDDRNDARDDRNDARDDRNDLRCAGNKCNIDIDDQNDLRCGCGGSRGDARDNRDDLRCGCGGNNGDARDNRDDLRCGCGGNTGDARDNRDDLRCGCGGNNGDARDNRDDLRCGCGGNNGDARDNRDDLRCGCGGNKGDARANIDDLRCGCGGNRDNRDDLRCANDRCGVNRDDIIDLTCNEYRCGGNKVDDDRDDTDKLRCRGNNCVRSKYNDNNNNLRYESQRRPKQYKISEDLDAVILDMSDLDRLLSNVNVRKDKLRGAKLFENFNLNNLVRYNNANDKRPNVEAVVFDLENKSDRDLLSKSIKRLLQRSE